MFATRVIECCPRLIVTDLECNTLPFSGYYKATTTVESKSVDFYFNLLPAVSGKFAGFFILHKL